MRSDLIAQINADNLLHNYRVLRARCRSGVAFCAPLKADAYGHGMAVTAPILQKAGADSAAVATIEEAVDLRQIGWDRPILILGNVLAVADLDERAERLAAIIAHDVEITIVDIDTVRYIIRSEPRRPVGVHVKVDSGMGRMGTMPANIRPVIEEIQRSRSLRLLGLYSHFATADLSNRDLAQSQLQTFHGVLNDLSDILPQQVVRHLANSAATIAMPEAHFDMVRPGLALYGYPPAPHLASEIELRPVLRLISHLTAVKELPAGHCVGYGQLFKTRRPTRLGIIPMGYFDGFCRALSSAATVRTSKGDAPVVGRISMDQMAVDLTDLPALDLGSEVTLIDDKPTRPNSVEALARQLNTIPYEVTCMLGPRIQRIRVGNFCG